MPAASLSGSKIPYYIFNFKDCFHKKVIEKFVKSYELGLTPNPCLDCNRCMKFDKLFERAKILECDYVVTGHYARIEECDGEFFLKKGLDSSKDQSYALYSMTQEQLAHTLLPLGSMKKTEVRALAKERGFLNAEKPESQDICFVPDGDYASFLERYTGKTYEPGPFLDTTGKMIGTHKGCIRYTVGQRRGLGVALGKPMYVKSINPIANTVTLAEEQDLYSNELTATDLNWISGRAPESAIECKAKVRYRQIEQPAIAYPLPNGDAQVVFEKAQKAIAPGQDVVLYDGDTVLGGGTII